MSAKRAKFRVGQVVAFRDEKQIYARINAFDPYGSWPAYYLALAGHGYELEEKLRPLTRREKGDAR